MSVAVADYGGVAVDAAPARPEDQREQRAGDADDEEDPADGDEIDAADGDVDGPDQDRPGGDEEEADADAHVRYSLLRSVVYGSYRENGRPRRAGTARCLGSAHAEAAVGAVAA